ncbi:hypothetical protein P8452_76716 [Trifolium repens]|nr:hypothetical protein P8452_76716 [Trifolium repens]
MSGADEFLNSKNNKNDHDWFLTPPSTPLFSSLEMETRKTVMSQLDTPTARPKEVVLSACIVSICFQMDLYDYLKKQGLFYTAEIFK